MKKALIFYGGYAGHTPFETAKIFEEMLKEVNFEVFSVDNMEYLDDEEHLKGVDLIIPVWTLGTITAKQCANVSRAVMGGAGLAGCHGGMCDAFRENTDWHFMTGAQWVAHPGNTDVTYTVNLAKDSIFTEGLSDFECKSEQYYLHIDPAVKIHATTEFPIADGPHASNGKVAMPVVYTKTWGEGRVFYCSLGHTYESFRVPEARIMMQRGFCWAAKS